MKKLETPILALALTAPRAAASIDVGVDFFQEHVAPDLRCVRRGSKTLYPVSEIERWLEANCEAALGAQVG